MSANTKWFLLLEAIFYAVVTSEGENSILSDKADEGLIPRVENGSLVRQGAYPWMMALLKGEVVQCSASLISTKTAITAAHCFRDVHVSEIHGRIGDVRWRRGRVVYFSDLKVHEDYNPAISLCLNDIALLILRETVELTTRIKTLALPSSNRVYVGNVRFTGWGSCFPGIGGQTERLRLVVWKIFNVEHRPEVVHRMNPLALNTLISTTSDKQNLPCPGDSGGLLIYGRGLSTKGIGLITYCVRPVTSGDLHLSVSTGYYADWIRRNSIGEIRFIR